MRTSNARKAYSDPSTLLRVAPSIWAYGFLTPPALGEKAPPPQTPPTHRLRPNEDPVEQLRPRRIEGSSATYTLVDVRDGHNVIDWFPGDHPSPMPDIIAHGPKSLGETARGCGSCHLPHGKGRPENAQPGGPYLASLVPGAPINRPLLPAPVTSTARR
jgi:hypothetical protein